VFVEKPEAEAVFSEKPVRWMNRIDRNRPISFSEFKRPIDCPLIASNFYDHGSRSGTVVALRTFYFTIGVARFIAGRLPSVI
jgi:hypothetical protein